MFISKIALSGQLSAHKVNTAHQRHVGLLAGNVLFGIFYTPEYLFDNLGM
jgi:hypothetical protein